MQLALFNRSMKIYTKTGDNGTTRLVDGTTVAKHSPRVEAYGTVDELNSYLGVVLSEVSDYSDVSNSLLNIQHHLFRIGSLVATEKKETFLTLPQIESSHIEFLEKQIDTMTAQLPPLKNFILPSGHKTIATTHFARALSRRAERRVSEMYAQDSELLQNVLIYLNRLSDYLYTLARYLGVLTQSPEIKWDKSL